ncbi:PadR family transcriptional regulator [Planctomonas psychrotolerans]|uniref:PadR family transcriptional regulator n=1 Tax=Planctomonas psychrotolerans TaxID=2528712 RepID=UPI00123B4015|nr:PadR family transcriptional regulator [Planctomonas psychrotolerans]
MEERTWPSEWLRGVLGAAILAIVADGETYGYRIGQRISEAGLGTVKGGTLYPILNRFEDEGLLASSWREGDGGPGRKYYSVTPSGADTLRTLRTDWREFSTNATAAILGKEPSP